jgi:hypothetical protein
LGVKILKFFDEDPGSGMEIVRIRDGKKSDPGSGINIPDPQDCLKELRILLFQRALYNNQAVMCLKKEIIISFFIITISASNLYMPMIWLYVVLQDFLIPFLCDPDLQCTWNGLESTLLT